jgi:hypothetical protein
MGVGQDVVSLTLFQPQWDTSISDQHNYKICNYLVKGHRLYSGT